MIFLPKQVSAPHEQHYEVKHCQCTARAKQRDVKNQKRLFNLEGESQRLINQPVMKVAFPTGRRLKANFVGPGNLHPITAAVGIFMSSEEETVCKRERGRWFIHHIFHQHSVAYSLLYLKIGCTV